MPGCPLPITPTISITRRCWGSPPHHLHHPPVLGSPPPAPAHPALLPVRGAVRSRSAAAGGGARFKCGGVYWAAARGRPRGRGEAAGPLCAGRRPPGTAPAPPHTGTPPSARPVSRQPVSRHAVEPSSRATRVPPARPCVPAGDTRVPPGEHPQKGSLLKHGDPPGSPLAREPGLWLVASLMAIKGLCNPATRCGTQTHLPLC